jgi:hypothetical protein
MHDGCSASFGSAREVIEKVRMMGFADQYLPVPIQIHCGSCGEAFEMETFENSCPGCGALHGVTPCHSFDPGSVVYLQANTTSVSSSASGTSSGELR